MTRTFTHTLLLFCYIFWYTKCDAQEGYGNEWIDYTKTYLRIPIAETGIYKVTATDLANQGIAIDSISATGIQMFVHGREVPIEVVSDSSGRLGRDGYILFSGKKNDGYADTTLYVNPDAMPHPYYNLYSDTTAYFLTWQNRKPGLRTRFPAPGAILDSAAFHWEEILQLFTSHYLPGRFFPPESNYETGSLLTAYDEGEGWTGPEIAEGASLNIVFKTDSLVRERIPDASLEIMLAGWAPGIHSFTLWGNNLKRKLGSLTVTGRETRRFSFKLETHDFDDAGRLTLTLVPAGTGGHVSLSYARMRYPQAGTHIVPGYIKTLPSRLVKFTRIDPETDYLIITHPLMRVPVGGRDAIAEYAQYRASEHGGNYRTAAVYSHELYDQFNAGQPGPQGIRNAVRWLHDQGNLKFVLLAGRSVDPQKARKMKDSWQIDMIPNAGWPGSDVALVTAKGSHVPLVPIGRINALTSNQLLTYLRKVQAVESEPPGAAWRNRILHLSGGKSRDELTVFKSYVEAFEKKLKDSPLAKGVTTISKLTDNAVEPVYIDRQVNKGVGLITLFGHSGIDVTDIDIGRAGDPARNYQNHPYYPAMIVNGCAAGSIFYSTQTLSSDWIFAPESGAVLFLAHTFNGPSTALKRYTEIFYEVLADSAFTSKPFGMIQREAIRRNLSSNPGIPDSITIQQMTLHGDPAIRIFPAPMALTDSQTVEPNQPPVMSVTMDGRQLSNDETVSPGAFLNIRLFDDQLPTADHDTTLVAVWVRRHCEGCADVRIPLRKATGKNINRSFYEITLPLALVPGIYTLIVQCRDTEGLSSPPYQIRFKVPASNGPLTATVAPNPSAHWFKFTIQNDGLLAANLKLTIVNPLGTTVFHKTLHCRTGLSEWFWHPAIFSPGFYHYSIQPAEAAGQPAFTFKHMRGHLLYTP